MTDYPYDAQPLAHHALMLLHDGVGDATPIDRRLGAAPRMEQLTSTEVLPWEWETAPLSAFSLEGLVAALLAHVLPGYRVTDRAGAKRPHYPKPLELPKGVAAAAYEERDGVGIRIVINETAVPGATLVTGARVKPHYNAATDRMEVVPVWPLIRLDVIMRPL